VSRSWSGGELGLSASSRGRGDPGSLWRFTDPEQATEGAMFKPYFSEWLVQQYFKGWWVLALGMIALTYWLS
jgi:hypothetical protein